MTPLQALYIRQDREDPKGCYSLHYGRCCTVSQLTAQGFLGL